MTAFLVTAGVFILVSAALTYAALHAVRWLLDNGDDE